MTRSGFTHATRRLAICALALLPIPRAVVAATFDYTVPPGANYDVAEFRLWHPDDAGTLRGVALLVPGSNGDGRPMADEPFWQEFATRHGFAILACRFTDKRHDQMFIEDYVGVSRGSGQAVLDALTTLADRSGHPELAEAPWVSWGMSAGGQVSYEMAVWKPERTIAFILNKGGIYYTALAPQAAQQVPGLLFVGETDLAFRNDIIRGIFSVNRRAGALWALLEEPGVGHEVARSRDLAVMFFDEVIPLRLPEAAAANGETELRSLDGASGFYGSMERWTFESAAEAEAPRIPVSWLPTERVARGWQAVRRGEPF